MTTITVCTTCRQPHLRENRELIPCGEAMLKHVQSAAESEPGVVVRPVSCLMGCEHGCNIAISGAGKMTYVLGSFTPTQEDAAAIVEYAGKHEANAGGVVPYREWPQGVKGHFTARVPPLDEPPAL